MIAISLIAILLLAIGLWREFAKIDRAVRFDMPPAESIANLGDALNGVFAGVLLVFIFLGGFVP